MNEELFQLELSEMPEADKNIRKLKDCDGRKIILQGFTKGKKCKECIFFYRVQYAKIIRRCKKYPKKYWKANFAACRYFEENR